VLLRNEKVMLDVHLAELYQVETRALKQAVRRNPDRFPEDFMFELQDNEIEQVVSQNVIPSKQYLGGAAPFAFTESGVAMLSSVLKSKRAVEMNIAIIRTFVMLCKLASNYQAVMRKLEAMDKKYEGRFKEIYKTLNYLINPPSEPMRKIGFKQSEGD
jgi:ORF6N domain